MKQYEIWWADLPEPAGRRPVLLLSRNPAYEYLTKFIAVEVTITLRNIPQEVKLGRAEGMARECAANFDNIRTIAKGRLHKRAGALSSARVAEVKRAFGFALAWRELVSLEP